LKVLVVDDDAASRTILASSLRRRGHDVAVAGGGTEAWDLLRSDHFPVLVTDWLMPEPDGLELCRRIRTAIRPRYTYIVLVTALSSKADLLRALDAGADDFLTKPVDEATLVARLRVAERVVNLQSEVSALSGLLPICAYCKKIRDGKDYWQQVETYVQSRTDATFSHGVCPDCYARIVQPQIDALRRPPTP